MFDMKYEIALTRLEGALLRRACITASAECDTVMASMFMVPDDLRTNGWTRSMNGLQDRKRRYEDLAEKMHAVAYPQRQREEWEDFVEDFNLDESA
jgi:hypothetical protein